MKPREHNYWLTTAEFPKTETRTLPNRVDVAVIGAGFTGLSAARTLAKRGAKVAVLFPENDTTIRRSVEILRRGMIDVYPQLRDAKVEYVWGGTLDFAFDIMPHAGQIDGMYYAVGYAGHGVAMATYQGQKMAELISGDKPENPFVGIAFPGAPLGLYNGKPWFLPFAGVWYKFLDWVS